MATMKQRVKICGLVVASVTVGASGATLYSQCHESIRLDGKLKQRAALTEHECTLLTETQRTVYAMKNPMSSDVACTAGI